MLTLAIDDLMLELEDGAVKHVGPKTTGATVKLYHVTASEASAFGDKQCKLAFADDEGNEVEVALDLEAAGELASELEAVTGPAGTDSQ
ncbi:hypothetical protein [Halolamina sp.]|jgi:Ethanolamine utilization protein EutJ (predicted chaperonin)|uniref:hypothetical protein n=1 Tax=Halolamina sp. TaxID=1940283 RepID=UPI000223B9A7|nr:hypothetical protein Halar_1543 [halophilic archaeon DL31]